MIDDDVYFYVNKFWPFFYTIYLAVYTGERFELFEITKSEYEHYLAIFKGKLEKELRENKEIKQIAIEKINKFRRKHEN
jgi:lysine/ornithine N-monooxygenase